MIEIVLGVGMFTTVVLALVALILIARAWLEPVGEASITVNDEKTFQTPLGIKLADALGRAGLFVPTARPPRGNACPARSPFVMTSRCRSPARSSA
jgi:Na+-transporting NADH:ubiquinone oxidoreductase subunit F